MSDLLWSRIDTTQLYPPFFERAQKVVQQLFEAGKPYWVIEGCRSYERSDALYAQGRTAPGPIVSNARAGQSAHNFGIAVDVVLDGYIDRAGLQPDWRPESYIPLGPVVRANGLIWGGDWVFKDRPHFQVPTFITAADMEPLRQAFAAGGLKSVWAYLDQHLVFPEPAAATA